MKKRWMFIQWDADSTTTCSGRLSYFGRGGEEAAWTRTNAREVWEGEEDWRKKGGLYETHRQTDSSRQQRQDGFFIAPAYAAAGLCYLPTTSQVATFFFSSFQLFFFASSFGLALWVYAWLWKQTWTVAIKKTFSGLEYISLPLLLYCNKYGRTCEASKNTMGIISSGKTFAAPTMMRI